jgi:hypothetical protein
MPKCGYTWENIIRKELKEFAQLHKDLVFEFENLGMIGYLSAMKHCSLLLGIHPADLLKLLIFPNGWSNLGSRQEGRLLTKNIGPYPLRQMSL